MNLNLKVSLTKKHQDQKPKSKPWNGTRSGHTSMHLSNARRWRRPPKTAPVADNAWSRRSHASSSITQWEPARQCSTAQCTGSLENRSGVLSTYVRHRSSCAPSFRCCRGPSSFLFPPPPSGVCGVGPPSHRTRRPPAFVRSFFHHFLVVDVVVVDVVVRIIISITPKIVL